MNRLQTNSLDQACRCGNVSPRNDGRRLVIHNAGGALLTITRSTVANNTALAAAGIDNDGSTQIKNTIVAGNTGTA